MAINRRLYTALEQRFGSVLIASEGEPMLSGYSRKKVGGPRELVVKHAGEYYRVNCPKCRDSRHRLYINHRWGVVDEVGNKNLHLMVCYNEHCYSEYKDFQELHYTLSGLKSEIMSLGLKDLVTDKKRLKTVGKVELPRDSVPIHDLPVDHEARRYLAVNRGLDPDLVSRQYGLLYCKTSHLYLSRERIIAPSICGGKVVGYQARPPFDADWAEVKLPKWATAKGTPRASTLYNYDQAKQYLTGVVVEGPGDVWKFGPWCHALLGSSFTSRQQQLFVEAHRGGSGILLLDPEAMTTDKVQQIIADMQGKLRHGFCGVVLPAGTDPGSLDSEFTRDYVAHEAKLQGVQVRWSKRRHKTR